MSYTAKSVILDIADNWGSSAVGIRQIDFWNSMSKISISYTAYSAYATSVLSSSYGPKYAFYTSSSKTGLPSNTSWYGTSATNQRLICVFDTEITFEEIRINNWHYNGSSTGAGAKNVVIHISTDEITSTTYNEAISNSELIFDGQFDEHIGSDVEDEQVLSLGGPKLVATPFNIGMSLGVDSFSLSIVGSVSTSLSAFNMGLTLSTDGFAIIAITPSPMSFGLSLQATGIQAGGFLGSSFPSLTMEGTISAKGPAPIEITFPAFDLQLFKAGGLDVNLPSLSMAITGESGRVGDFIGSLPGLNMEAFIAGYFDIDLPMLTQTITATPTVLAAIESTLPRLRISGSISRPSEGDIEATLPPFRMSIQGIPGAVVAVTASLQPMYMSGTLIPGQVANMDETLPKLRAAITAMRTGPAEIDGTLPSIRILAQSGEIESNVLRYVKERSR